MKHLPYLALFFLLSLACKKTDTPKPEDPGDPGNPNNPGNGAINITSVSPAYSYPGDTITITGTGFSADAAKDSIKVGYIDSYGLKTLALTGGKGIAAIKIISASATKLVIKTDSGLFLDAFAPIDPKMSVRIAVGADHIQKDTAYTLRVLPVMAYDVKTPYPNTNAANCAYQVYTYTNDSIFITGKGLYLPCKFYVDGKEVAMEFKNVPNPTYGSQQTGRGKLPIDFFGLVNPTKCDDTRMVKIKVVNTDGKTKEGTAPMWPGPNSLRIAEKFDSTKYHLVYGHTAKFNIKGYCLRSDMYMTLSGYDPGNATGFKKEFLLQGIHNFPSEFTVPVDLGALPTPSSSTGIKFTYNIKIGETGTYYGFYSDAFTLFN